MLLSQRFLSLDGLIMTSLQNSVLKISRHFVFVKFFKNFKILKYPGATLLSFARSYHSYPYKKYQRKSLFQPNIRRKQKSQKSINPEKVSIAKHYKVGYGKGKNQNSVYIKVLKGSFKLLCMLKVGKVTPSSVRAFGRRLGCISSARRL